MPANDKCKCRRFAELGRELGRVTAQRSRGSLHMILRSVLAATCYNCDGYQAFTERIPTCPEDPSKKRNEFLNW